MAEAVEIGGPGRIHWIFYGRSELRPGWRLLIFLAIVVICVNVSNFAVGRLLRGADDVTGFLVREVMDFLIFLFASWIMGGIEGRTIGEYGLPWQKMFRVQFWQGAVIGFAAISGLLVVMRIFGVFHFEGIALRGFDVGKWAITWGLVFLLVALREEFRARGYGQFTLSMGIGFWPAAMLSAAYFGYSHHGNSGEHWIGVCNAALFGLLACLLLQRTGNLWMPIGLHTAFDWGETYFYGVPDSGQVLPGHLLKSSSSGVAWLSGGSVGPEGSLLCTLLILVVWLISAARMREVKYPGPVWPFRSSGGNRTMGVKSSEGAGFS